MATPEITLNFFREGLPVITKVVTTETVDLSEVARDCELVPEGSLYFRGVDDKKVSFSRTPVSVKKLLETCGSEGDLHILLNPFDGLRFIKFKYGKSTKTFPATTVSWDEFTSWVLEVNPQYTGYELSAKFAGPGLELEARSEGEFQIAVPSFLRFFPKQVVDLTVTVKQGHLRSFSTFTGDRGVKDGMAILLGQSYDMNKKSHQNPKSVARLDGYDPMELTEEVLLKEVPKRYSGGRAATVHDLLKQTMWLLSAAYAACGESNSQTEATKRTFIDQVLILVAAIISTVLDLDDELELIMEYKFDNGTLDYIYRHLRALVALIEAKGECKLPAYRGQALVEMSSLKRVKQQDSRKRDWEEMEDAGTVGILTNADEWEFFVFRPNAQPPVTFRRLASDMSIVDWKDVQALQTLFKPVIEQLVGILAVECKLVKESAAKKVKPNVK